MVRNVLRSAAGVAAASACLAQPASAFYFDGWPGAGGSTATLTLAGPGGKSVTVGTETTPEGHPPVKPVTPPEVPEPWTAVIAAAGLAALAARRLRRTKPPGATAGG